MSNLVNKTCACGQEYTHIPVDAQIQEGLYWWNCSCQSTLTYPVADRIFPTRKFKSSRERAAEKKQEDARRMKLNLDILKATGKATKSRVRTHLKLVYSAKAADK